MNNVFENTIINVYGGWGKVYKCRRRSDSAMVAVKEIDIEKDEVLQ